MIKGGVQTLARVCMGSPSCVFRLRRTQLNSGYLGTYRGSHSWFETFAERPLSIPAVQSAALLPGPADIDGEAKLRELQSSDGNQLWETVAISETVKGEGGLAAVVTEKTVWHLQRNVHAERSFKEHEVVWTWTDNDSDQDVDPEAEEEDTGKGKGGNFVRHLRPGYRIRVAARAQVRVS